jgi:SAM-dependent methyltransferase
MTLWHCLSCNFDFFEHDPTLGLANDKLDQSRLQAAGLDIPTLEQDFTNGLSQAAPLVEEYIDVSDRGHNILEVGCSWGYFLKLAQDAGTNPYGVELNVIRANYVNQKLQIPCDASLDECEKRGIRFKKIFLFYVLEYVPNPLGYLQRLLDVLDEGGRLIIISPNLNDPLKNLWRNISFTNFFYDEHAINYFSPLSVHRLIKQLHTGKYLVKTRQGYSFVNHISWFLTSAPRTTGIVGGDKFVKDILNQLQTATKSQAQTNVNNEISVAANHLADMIQNFDIFYKQYLESLDFGNQIHLILYN